jgi:hypothetical protein
MGGFLAMAPDEPTTKTAHPKERKGHGALKQTTPQAGILLTVIAERWILVVIHVELPMQRWSYRWTSGSEL